MDFFSLGESSVLPIFFHKYYVGVDWERKLCKCFLQAEQAYHTGSLQEGRVLDLPEKPLFQMSSIS